MPEAIPHLCALIPNILVKCAELVMESKTSDKPRKGLKSSPKVKSAKGKLTKLFKIWKANGKSFSKDDPSRLAYLEAKANLQRLIRYDENLKVIKNNNGLMTAHRYDRSKVNARIKSLRGQKSSSNPLKLETPVGIF